MAGIDPLEKVTKLFVLDSIKLGDCIMFFLPWQDCSAHQGLGLLQVCMVKPPRRPWALMSLNLLHLTPHPLVIPGGYPVGESLKKMSAFWQRSKRNTFPSINKISWNFLTLPIPLKEGLGSERRPKDRVNLRVEISNTSSKLHQKKTWSRSSQCLKIKFRSFEDWVIFLFFGFMMKQSGFACLCVFCFPFP